MIYFETRDKAREFVKASGYPLHDNGTSAPQGRRWAAKLFA